MWNSSRKTNRYVTHRDFFRFTVCTFRATAIVNPISLCKLNHIDWIVSWLPICNSPYSTLTIANYCSPYSENTCKHYIIVECKHSICWGSSQAILCSLSTGEASAMPHISSIIWNLVSFPFHIGSNQLCCNNAPNFIMRSLCTSCWWCTTIPHIDIM